MITATDRTDETLLPRGNARVRKTSISFAGLEYEFLGVEDRELWGIPETLMECAQTDEDARGSFACIRCTVQETSSLGLSGRLPINWSWEGNAAEIHADGVRATVRDLGRGQYAASARVAPGRVEVRGLMLGLTGAIYDRVGSLMMHGTTIEYEGGAITFVGPSGAGKSTAAELCPGAPILAVDKTALYRDRRGKWMAAPLPEHRAGRLIDRRSSALSLPLLGVLRVSQSVDRVRMEEVPALQKLMVLRESLLTGDASAEARRFTQLERFANEVPVARVHTVLGASLRPVLQTLVGTG